MPSDTDSLAALPDVRPSSRPPRGRNRNLLLVTTLVLVLGGLPAGRYFYPRPVAQASVTEGPLVLSVSGPGTLDAITMADLATKVPGRLIEIDAERNDSVMAGAPLARLSSTDLGEQLAVAAAGREAAINAVAQAEAALDQARINLDKLDEDLARSEALLQRGVVGQSNYDAQAAAQAQAKAAVAQAEAALDVARAQVASAEASEAYAQAQVDEATLTAPFSGIVVERLKSPGDFIAAGTPILRLADPASIVLTARFDESLIGALRPGQPAEISFMSQPGTVISGEVLRLSRSVDSETREFTADIRPGALPENWAIGQRGSVRVEIGRDEAALTLPAAFVLRRDGETGVWRAEDGRARWQPVETGAHSDGRIEILSGLAAGDIAVTAERVYPGMRLKLAAAGTGAAP